MGACAMPTPSRHAIAVIAGICLQLTAFGAVAQSPALGEAVSASTLEAIDLIVDASGADLPPGSGTAAQGEPIYAGKCQGCHGASGEGRMPLLRLAGGDLDTNGGPVTSVGNYWPYATTLFDYIRRAMPANAPKSLTADEVYATTAYVLYLNGLVTRDTLIDRQSLPAIVMPNHKGFIDFSGKLD
jgi:mono/diheme cytochrome c family protein